MKIKLSQDDLDKTNYITLSNERFNNFDYIEIQINGEGKTVEIPVDDLMAATVSFLTRKNADINNQKNYK